MLATDKMSVVQSRMPLTQSDLCLALIGLLGRDWLAGPAVACGSAVNAMPFNIP